jgi:hypothetical protein
MIRMTTPMAAIDKKIAKEINRAENEILKKLSFIGENAVNDARANGDYLDRTGNLRSSVGYTILKNGETVRTSSFDRVKQEASKAKGESTKLLDELRTKFNTGFVLIVVAGMDYAVTVEARGRNVLSSSKLLAEIMAKRLI